ncbi:hypothetical protein U9M48_031110 [Paspalum notatum var. saurae]|uniref:Uncharacterized protein n=1 Tax=Paspalum notatum var. saurae TaxID=547442 RepID=A0AAQ3U240_PASNO
MIEAIGAGVSTSPSPGRLHSRRTHPGRRGRRRVAAYRRRAATFAGDKQTPVPFLRSSGPWRLAVGPPATPATSRRRKSATNVDLQNPNSTRPLRRPASHRPRRRLLRAVAQPALPRPAPPYAVGRLRTEVASCKLQNAILPVVDNTSARKLEKVSEMSLGYAEKLSYREDVGAVGMPEMFDPPEVVQDKAAAQRCGRSFQVSADVRITVANGGQLSCVGVYRCESFPILVESFQDQVFAIRLVDYDIILGT